MSSQTYLCTYGALLASRVSELKLYMTSLFLPNPCDIRSFNFDTPSPDTSHRVRIERVRSRANFVTWLTLRDACPRIRLKCASSRTFQKRIKKLLLSMEDISSQKFPYVATWSTCSDSRAAAADSTRLPTVVQAAELL